ncbi:MAG: hypothetical protein PVJ55_12305, partial [Anaerolineae bacterium]
RTWPLKTSSDVDVEGMPPAKQCLPQVENVHPADEKPMLVIEGHRSGRGCHGHDASSPMALGWASVVGSGGGSD